MALNNHVSQSLDFSNLNLMKSSNRYRSTIDTGAALTDGLTMQKNSSVVVEN